ncbi:MAG: YheU family protein [Cellvibrionaceae bacterium]
MIIPWQQLAPETLEAMLVDFATRDGTDYGVEEISTEDKVAQIRGLLECGDIAVVFDTATESCNLLSKEEIQQLDLS